MQNATRNIPARKNPNQRSRFKLFSTIRFRQERYSNARTRRTHQDTEVSRGESRLHIDRLLFIVAVREQPGTLPKLLLLVQERIAR